jgi:AcrR family transcriptional regulator
MSEIGGLRERKKQATWRTIHNVATDLFLERGYEAVSVDDIAEAANVAPSTFFNYFTAKESVVFDPDPMDSLTVRTLLAARPENEPLWTTITEVLLGYMTSLGSRLATQKQLRATSPTLRASGREVGDRIRDELLEWTATNRPGVPALESALVINLAMGAVLAAYAVWQPEASLDAFLAMARHCVDRAGDGAKRGVR